MKKNFLCTKCRQRIAQPEIYTPEQKHLQNNTNINMQQTGAF